MARVIRQLFLVFSKFAADNYIGLLLRNTVFEVHAKKTLDVPAQKTTEKMQGQWKEDDRLNNTKCITLYNNVGTIS